MPCLSTARRISSTKTNGAKTIGEMYKEDSDYTTEMLWDSDLASKRAYIYDYFHDDQPEKNEGMTYEYTTKTPVDVKFVITEYGSLSKDDPSAKIMFKPSMKISNFAPGDDFYYYETDYHKKFYATFPVGLYIDLPDEKGIYHKWFICGQDIQGNMNQKYFVLPCTYKLTWIERDGNRRIKRKMWGVLRSQSSYNSGLWTDTYITTTENQQLIWLPMNSITERLHYISNDNKGNQRFIVDIVCEHPDVWQLSKITRRSPFGTNKLGLYKTEFNPETDYIDYENMEMYADYYDSAVEPIEEMDEHKPQGKQSYQLRCSVSAAGKEIKINGSYKTLTCTAIDDSNFDVTDEHYSSIQNGWKCYLDGKDITDDRSLIKWLKCKHENQIKLKFLGGLSYIGKVLTIRCCITDKVYGELQLDIKSL